MLLIATLFSLLHFAFSECSDVNLLTFELTDSYGDGWNEAYLNVTDNDSSVQLYLYDGAGPSTTVLCVSGTVTIDFVGGDYDDECGYIVKVGGNEILSVAYKYAGPTHTLVDDDGYKLCPAGEYASDGSCESCPVGTFQPDVGQTLSTACQVCPAGTFQPEEGQTSCGACTAGKYSTVGQSSCESCPAGKYDHTTSYTSSPSGLTALRYCASCPAGKYSPEGQTSCGACPAGKSSTVGQAVCYTPIPNAVEGDRSLGIWQAVDTYETQATIDKYGQIEYWDTSLVEVMTHLFEGDGAAAFNGDISKWNTGAVFDMRGMFSGSQFNGDLSKWNTGAVTDMVEMFAGATAFNGDLSKWNVGNVQSTDGMFQGAAAFNGDISKWDVRKVVWMDYMFMHAAVFNSDISKWQPRHFVDIDDRLFWGHGMYSMFKDSGFKRPLCGGWWGFMQDWAVDGGVFYRCCDSEPCRMCEAGEYASAGSCTACPAGKFSRPESLDSSACFALSSVLSKTQLKAAYSTYSTC